MLKTAIVAMTIVGCDCDAKQCEYIRGSQPEWTTMSECETALKSRIVYERHEDYPTVIAVCSVADDGKRELAQAAFEEAVRADAALLTVSAETEAPSRLETVVQGGRAIVSRSADGLGFAGKAVGRAATGTFSLARGAADWVVATAAGPLW